MSSCLHFVGTTHISEVENFYTELCVEPKSTTEIKLTHRILLFPMLSAHYTPHNNFRRSSVVPRSIKRELTAQKTRFNVGGMHFASWSFWGRTGATINMSSVLPGKNNALIWKSETTSNWSVDEWPLSKLNW